MSRFSVSQALSHTGFSSLLFVDVYTVACIDTGVYPCIACIHYARLALDMSPLLQIHFLLFILREEANSRLQMHASNPFSYLCPPRRFHQANFLLNQTFPHPRKAFKLKITTLNVFILVFLVLDFFPVLDSI